MRKSDNTPSHIPVLRQEVLEAFSPCSLPIFYDGTLGAGGHAEALLSAHPEIVAYYGIDRDPAAIAIAKERLAFWERKVMYIQKNFSSLASMWSEGSTARPHGILLDLGVSSMQLDSSTRGFRFSSDAPLDMRMDPHLPITAAGLLAQLSERELGRILRQYGEERAWRRIARVITCHREKKPIETTQELAALVLSVLGSPKKGQSHPATRTFQALRIAVNGELEAIETFLPLALEALMPGGRMAVISFHSLEDRLVKQAFRKAAADKEDTSGIAGIFRDKTPIVRPLHKKAILPDREEIARNPRARSAKLRIVEKI